MEVAVQKSLEGDVAIAKSSTQKSQESGKEGGGEGVEGCGFPFM